MKILCHFWSMIHYWVKCINMEWLQILNMVKMVLYEEWMWNIEMQMKMLINQPNNLQEILLIQSRRWNQHNGRTRYDDTLIAANANSKFQENVSNKQTFLNHVGECCLKIGECCQKFCLCICTICLESSFFLLTVTKYFITFEFCGNYNMYLMLNFP